METLTRGPVVAIASPSTVAEEELPQSTAAVSDKQPEVQRLTRIGLGDRGKESWGYWKNFQTTLLKRQAELTMWSISPRKKSVVDSGRS
jgi:hypothetical protein